MEDIAGGDIVYNERRLCPHNYMTSKFFFFFLLWLGWMDSQGRNREGKLNHSAGGLDDVYKISDFCFATVIFACTALNNQLVCSFGWKAQHLS